ncbi:DNA-directed RNA polymerases I and III subunit RPAC2-like [Oppia nitens]|uniref:DNA-directed RNA polymerases I and III subunit RPAC2-like n=1 Tax=Oppia nitens TaxID=1686743 RepID=UPI0023DC3B8A|nr:DNA-directed RNA polymerases I and III subunit RPAC2-like [Oppia nitens]
MLSFKTTDILFGISNTSLSTNLVITFMSSTSNSSRFEVVELTNDGQCAIISLKDEDHTLANALRYIIVKNSNVKFCGYSMPHPNDNQCLIQIQTNAGFKAIDVFEKGLRDLMDVFQHMKHVFHKKHEEFVSNKNNI